MLSSFISVFHGDLVDLITLVLGFDTAKFMGLNYMLFVVFVRRLQCTLRKKRNIKKKKEREKRKWGNHYMAVDHLVTMLVQTVGLPPR